MLHPWAEKKIKEIFRFIFPHRDFALWGLANSLLSSTPCASQRSQRKKSEFGRCLVFLCLHLIVSTVKCEYVKNDYVFSMDAIFPGPPCPRHAQHTTFPAYTRSQINYRNDYYLSSGSAKWWWWKRKRKKKQKTERRLKQSVHPPR